MGLALPTVTATRFERAMPEGGSMPGLVEADDVKWRGAWRGAAGLVAEVVVGELARALGLRVPDLVLVDVDPTLADDQADPEIRELIHASGGLNVGSAFLPDALPYRPGAVGVTPELAAEIVWLDALTANYDHRTLFNPNLLIWQGGLWLIDHEAALDHGALVTARRPVGRLPITEHVLLPFAGSIVDADARLAGRVDATVAHALAVVPDAFLGDNPDARRAAYVDHFAARLATRAFVVRGRRGAHGRPRENPSAWRRSATAALADAAGLRAAAH
jgi:hypothetical protein